MARRIPLKAGRGYELVRKGRKSVTLRRISTGVGVDFTCGCIGTGGCKVLIESDVATCQEDGCNDTCAWTVKVPGLVGAKVFVRADN